MQAGLTADYYYIGKNPALAFGTAIPFGLTHRQRAAWLSHGGGLDLMRGIFSDFGIITFPCGSTGPQFGGWFREPVESLADMRGLRMRIPGLGGEIMARLGVSVQVLAAPEIYPALERGAIDATEWVGPYDDEKLGFYRIAKNYYIPGWWEPGVTTTLQVSLDAWNDLPPTYQEALASACDGANVPDARPLRRRESPRPVTAYFRARRHDAKLLGRYPGGGLARDSDLPRRAGGGVRGLQKGLRLLERVQDPKFSVLPRQ